MRSKKGRPYARKDTRTVAIKNMMPSSAGLTAHATCCLWNALIIIFKARRKVKPQISLFSSNLPHSEAAPQRASTAPKLGAPGRPPPRSRFRTKAGIQASRPQAARPPRRVSAAKGGGKGQNRFSGGVYAGKTPLPARRGRAHQSAGWWWGVSGGSVSSPRKQVRQICWCSS